MTFPLKTLAELPAHVAAHFPARSIVSRSRAGTIESITTEDYVARIRALGIALADLGVEPGARVAIMSESRPEWQIADLAILSIGGVTVPVYPSLAPEQARYVLQDCDARMVIVSTPAQAQKVLAVRAQLPRLETVIVLDHADAPGPDAAHADDADRGPTRQYADVIARGAALAARPAHDTAWHLRVKNVRPNDLATIIYTSGTTGEAKGVMLTHANLVSNALATSSVLPMDSSDVAMSFLPLSHAFERMVVYMYLLNGVTVAFAEAIETLTRDVLAVRPTIMTGVPRVYEKIQSRVVDAAARGTWLQRRLFAWALGVGLRAVRAEALRLPVSRSIQAQRAVADRLVFTKVRARLGGRLRCLVSGSAPLARSTADFFEAVGLPLREGYGLTETSPVLTVNSIDAPRAGTVGRPIPGVELRIGLDGEILARGPNVMLGYYRKPEATTAVLVDGWFHTGDIGAIDADGYLTITDRKKDLIVTSGGKKIAPQPIEARLRTNPLVSEAVLIGDRRKFATLLIVPDFRMLATRLRWDGKSCGSPEDWVFRLDVRALYEPLVDEINAGLAQFERIKRFALLPTEFSIETGELTPTMKVKRKVVEERWKDVIEELYAE